MRHSTAIDNISFLYDLSIICMQGVRITVSSGLEPLALLSSLQHGVAIDWVGITVHRCTSAYIGNAALSRAQQELDRLSLEWYIHTLSLVQLSLPGRSCLYYFSVFATSSLQHDYDVVSFRVNFGPLCSFLEGVESLASFTDIDCLTRYTTSSRRSRNETA